MFRPFTTAALLGALPLAAAGQTYDLTVNSATSSAAWNVSMNAPFATGGVSHILGSYDATSNPTGTRTLPGLFGSDNGQNNPISITDGGASASADSGTTPLHPAGSFRIVLDTEANQCVVSGFTADILNGDTVGADAEISITYSSFRTRQPTCTIIGGFAITVPLGTAEVTALTALQDGEAPGTLTPAGANQYTFAAPMTVVTTVTATLSGAPVDVPAQTLTVPLVGTITLNANDTASISATLDLDNAQTEPGPIALDPIAFDEPICGGHLMVHVTLNEIAFSFGVDGAIHASGPLVPPPPACDPDVNCDGVPDQGDVACIILAVAGDLGCFCQADPDFNFDGVPDQGDVADVILVVAGAPCP